jgi:hypothetical protein
VIVRRRIETTVSAEEYAIGDFDTVPANASTYSITGA